SPMAGVVTSLLVKTGDQVSQGSDIIVLDTAADSSQPSTNAAVPQIDALDATENTAVSDLKAQSAGDETVEHTAKNNMEDAVDLVVLGAGPGGYTAAFRAADLGLNVVLVERYPSLGGVCLNVGCIPSKALLHTAAIIRETQTMASHGVSFSQPTIDVDKLRAFKDETINKLTNGLAGLSKQRKVTVVHGVGRFSSSHTLVVSDTSGTQADRTINFKHAIIAAGSSSIRIPGFPYDDSRLIDSTGALALSDIPNRMLVIGGGIIGLEMGCVYAGLGSQISIVELSDGLMPGCDRDLVRPLEKHLRSQFEAIYTRVKVTDIHSEKNGLRVAFDGEGAPSDDVYDRVLLAVGRSPNGQQLDAEKAGVTVDKRGFVPVDSQQRTNVAHIFAIGDIVGQPMLAHKATHEGKVAAEVIAGHNSYFDAKTIPSVAYTDPEVAWMGLTETDAKEQGISYEKGSFPWAASGRSLSMGRSEGLTKIIYDSESKQLLGAGIVGPNAGELIAEAVLALEMGADIEDLALTVHPHPTLSETLNFAAEVAEGTVTDIYAPKR
ncbi:MAG: dihydrolipoyl dehydrogenase, partial [Granulosicoccus sp.]|nr:dihydrolipoyl dehydrogenase [Granulosicoccus sp.]